MKIGFVDYFLDEWHANNYPGWIREKAAARGWAMDLRYAYGDVDKAGGLSTAQWCGKYGAERCETLEALVEKSDAILVLSPDHSGEHERLAALALASGKPVYVDKTFAPDLACGRRMYERAADHGTPLFSSSALRFSEGLAAFAGAGPSYVATTGPGGLETYAVHQAEMIVALLGSAPERVLYQGAGEARQLLIDYGQAKASLLQMPGAGFGVDMAWGDGRGKHVACEGYFDGLIEAILTFYRTGQPPVSRAQTLAVMALLETARRAAEAPGQWMPVPRER